MARSVARTSRNARETDVLAEISEAMWRLLAGGKPRFPMIAAEFGLSPPQLHLMRMLNERDSLPMGQLAELLFCDASNVTVLVDRLEERALIERRPDPDDRRVKRIALTVEGAALLGRALERLFVAPPGVEGLSATDRRKLRDLLVKAVGLQAAAGRGWD